MLAENDEDMVDSITDLCLSPALRDRMASLLDPAASPGDWRSVIDATHQLYERARVLASLDRVGAPIHLV